MPLTYLLVEKVIVQQAAEWREWTQTGGFYGPPNEEEIRLGGLQMPVITADQLGFLLEFCHVISPGDSPDGKRRKMRSARDFIHSQGSAFWFALPGPHSQRGEATSEGGVIAKEETEEHSDAWALIVDIRWFLSVLARLLEPSPPDLPSLVDDRGILQHRHLVALWNHTLGNGERRGNVPEYLCVRLHALLEAMEVVWTPSAHPDEVGEMELASLEFISKGHSIVPALFQATVPYNWVKWETFLGRSANEHYEGEMMIAKSSHTAETAPPTESDTELYLAGMEGDVKFERWWIFSFLPKSFLSRFLLRFLHSVNDLSQGTHDTLWLIPDVHWTNGAAFVNERDGGNTAVILTIRPFSTEVNKRLRSRYVSVIRVSSFVLSLIHI